MFGPSLLTEDDIPGSSLNGRDPLYSFPVNSWRTSLAKSPMFTQAEIDRHASNSGKKYPNIGYHSLPSGLNEAKAFLVDEYLEREIQTHCM